MSRITELEKQITELDERKVALQKELELEKQKTEIECPFENQEDYWVVQEGGTIEHFYWDSCDYDTSRYEQGHVFNTREEAERERDRRALLTRFRQFRDKCNGDWKPDFKDDTSWKYYISFNHTTSAMKIYSCLNLEEFNLFGYFRKESDAARAIQLFRDEIKRLFLEVAE